MFAGSDLAVVLVQASKKRKDVDRRASKGRKIRYQVVDKMINFMVPKDSSNDEMVSTLFSNLFGQVSKKA